MIRMRLHLLALLSYPMGSGGLHRWMGRRLCGLARVWEVSYGGKEREEEGAKVWKGLPFILGCDITIHR